MSLEQEFYKELSRMNPEDLARSICHASSHQSQFLVLYWLSEQSLKLQDEVRKYTKDSTILEIIDSGLL